MNIKFKNERMELEVVNLSDVMGEKLITVLMSEEYGKDFGEIFKVVDPVTNRVEVIDGIKIIDGINRYQCSYSCSCGNSGKRYIKEEVKAIHCHKCNTLLDVVPAVENKINNDLMPNDDLDYFIAY